MTKIFGLPILTAIIAGILFPYAAISLMPYGFVFLFLLMLLSGLTIDWHRVPGALKRSGELFCGLFFLFAFFPMIQLFLIKLFIKDAQFFEGAVFASLMPVAIVGPFFTRQLGGDEELSFLLMVVSMVLAPFVAPVMLKWLTGSLLPIKIIPLMNYMLLLVTLPLLFSLAIAKFFPIVRDRVAPILGVGNMLLLGALVFIFFGTAVGKLNIRYESSVEIGKLAALAFFQDFGVLVIARFLTARLFEARVATALTVSLAMKNAAIAAGILLFYDPRAALAPSLVFIAHACLYSVLPSFKKYIAVPPSQGETTSRDNAPSSDRE